MEVRFTAVTRISRFGNSEISPGEVSVAFLPDSGLGNQQYISPGLSGGDGGPQAGPSTAYDQHVSCFVYPLAHSDPHESTNLIPFFSGGGPPSYEAPPRQTLYMTADADACCDRMRPMKDLLLRGATLIDPGRQVSGPGEILISDGIIRKADGIDPQSCHVVDIPHLYACPGWIDLHVHTYWGVSHYGIEADPHCLARGVTTALDAGSAGAQTYPAFERYVLERSETRLFAMLNISSQGMLVRKVGELEDIRYADVEAAVETCRQNPNFLKGIKIRLTPMLVGKNARKALPLALEAAEELDLPLMVHPNGSEIPMEELVDYLRAGDILTHMYHGWSSNILDKSSKVLPEVTDAVGRGVVMDVGHGNSSFQVSIAKGALDQGLLPTTISSDIHAHNVDGPVYDLATTASKFLSLGLSLDQVISRITDTPARILGMEGRIGTLREGSQGDVTIFKIEEGEFSFSDSYENIFKGDRRLVPVLVVREGKVHEIDQGHK